MSAVVRLPDMRRANSLDGGEAAQPGAEPKARRSLNAAAARAVVVDWLDTQARVVEHMRDLLLAEGEDAELIAALDAHAAFLGAAARR
ncbi:MAG: hypothetical protein PVI23_03275 [Maricaulaceae bacterium]